MAKTTPSKRALIGRIGAYTVHARYDSRELTEPARRAFNAKFLDEVDAQHELPLEERERRAQMARKTHFARLAYLSAKARRRTRARTKDHRTMPDA